MPPETMIVNVTEGHIDDGIPEDAGYCPIAIAVYQQLFPDDWDHNYWSHTVEVMHTRLVVERMIYDLPEDATLWITQYDDEGIGNPITFEVHHIATLI